LWAACGVRVPDGEGPIHDDYGVSVVRLNPWHGGETVFVRRIDPVRARLIKLRTFHFVLYVLGFEIVPVLLIYKLLLRIF
jgi:hypothetical protein